MKLTRMELTRTKLTRIRLSDIPNCLLGFIVNDKKNVNASSAWYNGKRINEIFKFKGLYRINTDIGHYRVSDCEIEIEW